MLRRFPGGIEFHGQGDAQVHALGERRRVHRRRGSGGERDPQTEYGGGIAPSTFSGEIWVPDPTGTDLEAESGNEAVTGSHAKDGQTVAGVPELLYAGEASADGISHHRREVRRNRGAWAGRVELGARESCTCSSRPPVVGAHRRDAVGARRSPVHSSRRSGNSGWATQPGRDGAGRWPLEMREQAEGPVKIRVRDSRNTCSEHSNSTSRPQAPILDSRWHRRLGLWVPQFGGGHANLLCAQLRVRFSWQFWPLELKQCRRRVHHPDP